MEKRTFKNKVYQELAKLVKALSNPHRLEILELLAQMRFSVEEIASQTGLTVANASQHLQVMRRVQLVETKREGNYVYYRLTDQNVYKAWKVLRDLGMEHMAEIERVIRSFRKSRKSMETLTSSELIQKIEQGEVTVLDVRPRAEYEEGHIAGALNMPVEELEERIEELPKNREIVAYCRGPFCVFADDAVELLTQKGLNAKRLGEGFPEWVLDELPVVISRNKKNKVNQKSQKAY